MTGFFTGIARWATFDALKSVFIGLVITVGLGMAITAYRDFKTGLTAKAHLQCVQAVADGNEQAARELDTINAKALQAANTERQSARSEAEAASERVVELEASLRALAEDPVCYPQSIARSLRQ